MPTRDNSTRFPFMRIDPAGWPFVIGGLVVAVVAAFFAGTIYGLVLLGLTTFFLFFFRDPERHVDAPAEAVLSPADGRVMLAGQSTASGFPASQWQQISIFLSPMDVHINRMPVTGTILKVAYHPGRFMPAFKAEAGDLNEFTEVTVDHGGQTIVVRQIVGILARRIVCRMTQGDRVQAGDRMGVMKFGSRMDVFLPLSATVHSRVNDKVVGGRTVIATLSQV